MEALEAIARSHAEALNDLAGGGASAHASSRRRHRGIAAVSGGSASRPRQCQISAVYDGEAFATYPAIGPEGPISALYLQALRRRAAARLEGNDALLQGSDTVAIRAFVGDAQGVSTEAPTAQRSIFGSSRTPGAPGRGAPGRYDLNTSLQAAVGRVVPEQLLRRRSEFHRLPGPHLPTRRWDSARLRRPTASFSARRSSTARQSTARTR